MGTQMISFDLIWDWEGPSYIRLITGILAISERDHSILSTSKYVSILPFVLHKYKRQCPASGEPGTLLLRI